MKEEYTAEKIQELIDELKQREIISKAERRVSIQASYKDTRNPIYGKN